MDGFPLGSGTTSSSGGQHFPAGVLAKLAIAAYVCAGVNPRVDPWEDLADGDIRFCCVGDPRASCWTVPAWSGGEAEHLVDEGPLAWHVVTANAAHLARGEQRHGLAPARVRRAVQTPWNPSLGRVRRWIRR